MLWENPRNVNKRHTQTAGKRSVTTITFGVEIKLFSLAKRFTWKRLLKWEQIIALNMCWILERSSPDSYKRK
jgi:hypothetical protein